MGCSSSKGIDAAAVDIYRPPPSSYAVFDINSIKEPWLSLDSNDASLHENQEKIATHHVVPPPILDKLNKLENEAPHSWDEVSKALEDLKPSFHKKNPLPTSPKPDANQPPPPQVTAALKNDAPRKSFSFHTLEELEAKLNPKETKSPQKELRKTEFKKTTDVNKTSESRIKLAPATESDGGGVIKAKPLKDNIFIVRDREEREKEGKAANYEKMMSAKRNPLGEYPEKCPPGGADSVVIYTTSLRGVRRTHEDCTRVRDIMELQRVVYDERDVSFHGGFLNELKELLGEGVSVPRVFVKGRYIGGVEEVVELNETGRLGRILNWARVERGIGRQACEGCGGARFVPCLDCGGSCKVLVDGVKERCCSCNENGLVICPTCL